MSLPFLFLPLYIYQMNHPQLLHGAPLPSSILASIWIDLASLLKLLCTELLLHLWRKRYCVIQLNVTSVFSTAANIFFLDIPSFVSLCLTPLQDLLLLFDTSAFLLHFSSVFFLCLLSLSSELDSVWAPSLTPSRSNPLLCCLSLFRFVSQPVTLTCLGHRLSSISITFPNSPHDLLSLEQFRTLL